MDTVPETSSAARRALRLGLSAAKWIVVLSGGVLLLVGLVNLRDEELTPEAQALAEFQRPPLPEGQNAYLALVGFDAPMGVDPIAAGIQVVTEHEVSSVTDPLGAKRVERIANAGAWPVRDGHLKFVGDTSTMCDPISKPCLQPSPTDAKQLRAMAEANKQLIARYLDLQHMTGYANTSVPDPLQPMPSGGWRQTRNLLLTQASLDGLSGKEDQALAFLAADLAFWRRVLGTDSQMIDEMIAVRVLASDLALLSELIATPSFDVREHMAQLRRMLAPLTPAERNAGRMFKREFASWARLIVVNHEGATRSEDNDWANRYASRLLWKKSASLNDAARFFTLLQTLGSHPPADFSRLRRELEIASKMSGPGIAWTYNPIGKMLVRIGVPAYPDFVARVFDLAAYVQLVRAQLEVRLAALPSESVPAFLASAGPEARNAYSDQPFNWDAANRMLSFEPMSQHVWPGWHFKASVPPPMLR